MKLKCLACGKTFIHPAKKTEYNHFFPKGGDLTIPPILEDQTETHVCPFCKSPEIDEFVEPQPQIVSVKSVPIEDADALIKDGYVVLEVYAKTVNLVKKGKEEP